MQKRDSANTTGNRRAMLEGASKHFVWSRVASSHPSHRLKMQAVSPQAVTKTRGRFENQNLTAEERYGTTNSTFLLVDSSGLLREGNYKA